VRSRGGSALRAVVALSLVGSVAGCKRPPTALVLAVRTDLGAPTEIDTIEISASRGGADRFRRTYDLATALKLPGTLTFQNGDGESASEPTTYVVRAKKASEAAWKVTRTARLGFVDEHTKLLRLSVERACVTIACSGDSTCVAGKCVSPDVDASALPDFESNDAALAGAAGAGASGTAGGSGGSGVGGKAGSSGVGGAAGGGGKAGSGGVGGLGGSSGVGGAGGVGGIGGSGGVGGSGGIGGSGGVGGSSGASGQAGGAGKSGSGGAGAAGKGGASGGASGQGGTGGASGAAGAAGGSGMGGSGGGALGCVDMVAPALAHTCARKTDGTAWCWGTGADSEVVDDGSKPAVLLAPTKLPTFGTSVAQIVTGMNATCVRDASGQLSCWGRNSEGGLGLGSGNLGVVDVPTKVALPGSVDAVYTGETHACVRLVSGDVWCWGENLKGQLGDGTLGNQPMPVPLPSLGTDVAEMAIGDGHTCALKVDGSLLCWGDDGAGALGDGTTVDQKTPLAITSLGTGVAHVTAGNFHTCALMKTGSVMCWGDNGYGQVNPTASNQTCPSVAACLPTPTVLTELGTTVAQVSAGSSHTCARMADGSVFCWGATFDGQLSDGPMVGPLVQVAGPGSAVDVQAGQDSSCMRKTDGSVVCWGRSGEGQLGTGTSVGSQCGVGVCMPTPMVVALPCP
jgi:alpha-tubulin suppressor-like RCC1 family protein